MGPIRQGATDRCEAFARTEEGGWHPNPTFPGIQGKRNISKMVKFGQRLKDCHAMSMLQSENELKKMKSKAVKSKNGHYFLLFWLIFCIIVQSVIYQNRYLRRQRKIYQQNIYKNICICIYLKNIIILFIYSSSRIAKIHCKESSKKKDLGEKHISCTKLNLLIYILHRYTTISKSLAILRILIKAAISIKDTNLFIFSSANIMYLFYQVSFQCSNDLVLPWSR